MDFFKVLKNIHISKTRHFNYRKEQLEKKKAVIKIFKISAVRIEGVGQER